MIAGASGSMGTTALLRLKDIPGVKVRAADIKLPRVKGKNISFVRADLTKKEICEKITKNIDFVLMFAAIVSTAPVMAKNPVSHVTTNMMINSRMLEASYFAGVKKFLWLSSTTGYPEKNSKLKEEDMFYGDPPDNYFSVGWMSRYTEILCRMYATKLKKSMAAVILRPINIYSEYESFDFEKAHVLPSLVRKVVERQNPIEVWGDGKQKKDLVYADDVFDACLLALKRNTKFNAFNIGSGKEYSINELLKIIIKADGYGKAKVVHNLSKPSTIKKRSVDIAKAKKILGFETKTTIEKGIFKMLKWYKENQQYQKNEQNSHNNHNN